MNLTSVLDKGTGIENEDALIYHKDFFMVVDGATPIAPIPVGQYKTQAKWFVEEFKHTMLDLISQKNDEDVFHVFKHCIDKINARMVPEISLDIVNTPSMTMAAVKINNDSIECMVLGDCSIYYLDQNDNVKRLYDNRVDIYSQKTIELFNKYRNTIKLEEKLKSQRSINRKSMNSVGGYWVATISDVKWVDQVVKKKLKRKEIKSLLLCTDGYDRIFSLFNITNPKSVLLKECSLEDCLFLLRDAEKKDNECIIFPRLKKTDDAAALMITLGT